MLKAKVCPCVERYSDTQYGSSVMLVSDDDAMVVVSETYFQTYEDAIIEAENDALEYKNYAVNHGNSYELGEPIIIG